MTLLPADKDVLENICGEIARDHYGFLYIADRKTDIKSAYENADTGLFNARSLSASDLRKGLTELAADEFADIEQLRDGVFYVDPFSATGNENITDELIRLFGQRLVVTGETLRSRFSLAIDDIDFFAGELADRGYVRRITAGKRDYYTIGPRLKEHADDVGLDARLQREASAGKIAHDDLERVIDVAATEDVIRYLDREGYIVDLDGEYLVEEAIDEYGAFLAGEIEDAIEATFAESSHVLRREEFETVIENEIATRFDVLSNAQSVRGELLEAVDNTLSRRLDLDRGSDVVVSADAFDAVVDEQARRILEDVKGEHDVFAAPSEFVERAGEHFEEIRVANDPTVNEYVRDTVEDRYREIVTAEEF